MSKTKLPSKTKLEAMRKAADGDCFYVAAQIVLYNPFRFEFVGEPKNVQAVCTGRKQIAGVRFAHGFVEDDFFVYDFSNGNKLICLKNEYYRIGKINSKNEKEFKAYTKAETLEKMLEKDNYFFYEIESDY